MTAPAVFAVLGDPVGHSLSPTMHNGWFADYGVNAAYVALRVKAQDAARAFQTLGALGLAGANVTVPLKEIAAETASQREASVDVLNAANVLLVGEGSELAAFNTDAAGFILALDDDAPGWRDRVRRALVVGAGGAGRAIAYGLKQAGVAEVTLANRDLGKAQAFAERIGAASLGFDRLRDGFAGADLIVNATTLGMGGAPYAWPIESAPNHAIVADAVYAPLDTGLLLAARARGLVSVDGLGMLVGQGALAFQLWFGIMPDRRMARARLMAALAERGG